MLNGVVVGHPIERRKGGNALNTKRTEIHLKVIGSEGQQVATECVGATRLSDMHFRLEETPAMVLGAARGDVIELLNPSTGDFGVIERSGLLAIQVFGQENSDLIRNKLERVVQEFEGYFDSHDTRETSDGTAFVVTVSLPVSKGFKAIEAALDQAVKDINGAEWYFGNVYDPVDGVTPLNWWVK